MARDEFSARNGTLSINLQTRIQRSKIGERFTATSGKALGVASNNAKPLLAEKIKVLLVIIIMIKTMV